MANEDEVGRNESGGNDINLSNPSALKKSIRVDYLTYRGAKRGGGNTKKGITAARCSNYLNSAAKKTFNYL